VLRDALTEVSASPSKPKEDSGIEAKFSAHKWMSKLNVGTVMQRLNLCYRPRQDGYPLSVKRGMAGNLN
jgi:hypothetical protein